MYERMSAQKIYIKQLRKVNMRNKKLEEEEKERNRKEYSSA